MENDDQVFLVMFLEMFPYSASALSGRIFGHEVGLPPPSLVGQIVHVTILTVQITTAGNLP